MLNCEKDIMVPSIALKKPRNNNFLFHATFFYLTQPQGLRSPAGLSKSVSKFCI